MVNVRNLLFYDDNKCYCTSKICSPMFILFNTHSCDVPFDGLKRFSLKFSEFI